MSSIPRNSSNRALVREESSISSYSLKNGHLSNRSTPQVQSPSHTSKPFPTYDDEPRTKGSTDMNLALGNTPNTPYVKKLPASIGNVSRGLHPPDHHQIHIFGSKRPTRSLSRENIGTKTRNSGNHTRHRSTSNLSGYDTPTKEYPVNGIEKSSEVFTRGVVINEVNQFGPRSTDDTAAIIPPIKVYQPDGALRNGRVEKLPPNELEKNYEEHDLSTPGKVYARSNPTKVGSKVSQVLQHIDPRAVGHQLRVNRNPNTSYHHMQEEMDERESNIKYANMGAEFESPEHVSDMKTSRNANGFISQQRPNRGDKRVIPLDTAPTQYNSSTLPSKNRAATQRNPTHVGKAPIAPFYTPPQQAQIHQVAYLPQHSVNQNNRTGTYQTVPDRFSSVPHLPLPKQNVSSSRDAAGNSSFYESNSSIYSLPKGATVSFHGISYIVKSKRWPWSEVERKTVLNNVSGYMKPGMNAIMGPTGSGKSSLLDVLAGRKDPRYLDGDVLVDGRPQPPNFKCISGYVVQDDIVMGTLTVKENLQFSAALRLPKEVTEEARERAVTRVMDELGLSHIANSKIGTELIRGVSGGERKRTNIGIELITDPSVLFLDEPTTGLDAFTANSVIKTLRNLSLRGRTIVFSIHQPKYSIYKLFDTLTLVCRGELVYHGSADHYPLSYFNSLGYICEEHNNPPDFFLDILNEEVKSAPTRMITQDAYVGRYRKRSMDEIIIQLEEDKKVTTRLIECWKNSREARHVQRVVSDIYTRSTLIQTNNDNEISIKQGVRISYRATVYTQMWHVSWRTALNLVRNPQASIIQLAVYLFFALSVGAVYTPLNDSVSSGIQNRTGLFFFTILQMVFVNLGAVEVFIKERQIFIHETSSGFYRTSAYFIAKIFCDMLPIKALPVVLFMPITYWMVGLKREAGPFFFFELTLLLTTMSACGIAFFVSASVSVFGIANIFISITYVFMMVFGGYLINLQAMQAWISWCQHLSIFRYSFSALSVNEFVNATFCDRNNVTTANCTTGEWYLNTQNISYLTSWDQWKNILGLILITIFFCCLCYVQLRRIKRYK